MTTTPRHAPRTGLAIAIAIVAAIVAAVAATISPLTPREASTGDPHQSTQESSADNVVALTVDGVDVPIRQLRVFLRQARSDATEQSGFQSTQAVAAEIFDAAARAAATDVMQFIDASKAGLLPNPDYSAYLTQLETENSRRFEAVEAGEVIYGPQHYSEENFRAYLLGGIKETMTQSYLADGTIVADEEQIKAYFNSPQGVAAAGGQDPPLDSEIAIIRFASHAYDQIVEGHVAQAEIILTSHGEAIRGSMCPVEGTC